MTTTASRAPSTAPHDWAAEHAEFAAADARAPLAAEELEQWAVAAHMLGRDDEVIALRERALQSYLDRGLLRQAGRCGFWIGFHLGNNGQLAQAAGYRERLRRMVEAAAPDPYLTALETLADAVFLMRTPRAAEAIPMLDQVARVAQDAGDDDVLVLAIMGRGAALRELGRSAEALVALDEAMVLVLAGRVAPQVVGIAYCSMINQCMERYDIQRAGEWTRALSGWCEEQSGLVPYRGLCQVHRAEIFQLRGSWAEALAQAEQTSQLPPPDGWIAGAAQYRLAELHRLRGRLDLAERGYAAAGACGREVQPGLALLRVAQGRPAAGLAGLDRALAEDEDVARRSRLLAAMVEVALASGDLDAARSAADELAANADDIGTPYLAALAAHASGLMCLANGDPRAALPLLRRAWSLWQEVDVPYEAARTRAKVGAACRALGDDDAARMELDAARTAFEQLGAAADLAALEGTAGDTARPGHPLSSREREVLALVAQGHTNRAIATRLFLSEKTVARHLSNIFAKLNVGSRAAATAYAYEHGLV
jgi:DNA-binding CsgD family transcriptional regulator